MTPAADIANDLSRPCDPQPLLPLVHHRWCIPVLAAMYAGDARHVQLVHRLGVAQDTLRATLAALARDGWVRSNPGHGHPLRPEILLTDDGRRIARHCARLHEDVARLDLVAISYRKWTLPTLVALETEGVRFRDLAARLVSVTPRALTQALQAGVRARLIDRAASGNAVMARYAPLPDGILLQTRTRSLLRDLG